MDPVMANNNSKRVKVWLDCDPGHDDAFAIMFAGYSSSIELLGISTVHGNQSVAKTTANALKTLAVSGLTHIKVIRGKDKPLCRPSIVCEEIHGESGLDCSPEFANIMIKEEQQHKDQLIQNKNPILHMYETFVKIGEEGEKVTLLATGTLTNVALLLSTFPEVKFFIEEIIIMGGAIGVGNMTPAAEWNILVDPEAAKIVFDAGMKFTMIPLEVTHTALVTPDVVARIKNMNSKFADLCVDLLHIFADNYKNLFRFEYPPLHDPLTIAYVINRSLFETELMRVDIETSGVLTSGRTVCDIYGMSKSPKNVSVAKVVNVPEFWNLILSALELANKASPLNS